jgi:pimeloyl-ACP methyl ester carboxylesterase
MRAHVLSPILSIIAALAAVPATARAQGSVQWGDCPPVQEGFPDIGDQECALIRVPLDYREPRGAKIGIAISRIRAADPAQRRGVLLLNIGGPGGRGLDMPRLALALYPQNILDSYDLIGFDPRGVGRSAPITCGLSPEVSFLAFPTQEQEGGFAATVDFARDVAGACEANAGSALPFMTTANTARDMERIRVALGEEMVSYLGYSYGTYLGAVYASLFPSRADRFVLDSSVHPDWVWRAQFRSWGEGGDARFVDFIDYAIANDATLNFGDTPDEIRALYFRLFAQAEAEPVIFDEFIVDGPLFRLLTFAFLQNDVLFSELARLWQTVQGSAAAAVAAPPRFPEVPPDNADVSAGAVLCGDVEWSRSIRRYRRELAIDTRRSPMFGAIGSNIWPCAFWPNSPIEPAVPLSSEGPADHILIVNTLRDPNTPLPGAERMHEVLGQRARLVLVDAGGHGVFGLIDNICATDAVSDFLAEGVLPPSDTSCPAGAAALSVESELRSQASRAAWREMSPIRYRAR